MENPFLRILLNVSIILESGAKTALAAMFFGYPVGVILLLSGSRSIDQAVFHAQTNASEFAEKCAAYRDASLYDQYFDYYVSQLSWCSDYISLL